MEQRFEEPTLARWRTEQERKDRQRAEEQERRDGVNARAAQLERAFNQVRNGMPDLNDKEQSARVFAANWANIARLLRKSPDLVHQLDEIAAEPHSPKAYALRFVRTALVDEARAAKMLLGSWEASKESHSQVLHWLTGGFELEIMGRKTEDKSRSPSAKLGRTSGKRLRLANADEAMADAFIEFSPKQRKLLLALCSNNWVPITKVKKTVYGAEEKTLRALEELVARTNRRLSQENKSLEIKRKSNALSLQHL
jgi:hypothetical protein